MKKVFSLLIALILIFTSAVNCFAATKVTYPVVGVFNSPLLANDKGYVNLDSSSGTIPYGKTAYFALANKNASSGGTNITSLQTAMNTAETAKNTAESAKTAAENAKTSNETAITNLTAEKASWVISKTNLENAKSTLETAKNNAETDMNSKKNTYESAESAYNAASNTDDGTLLNARNSAKTDYDNAVSTYNTAKDAYDKNISDTSTCSSKISTIETEITTRTNNKTSLENDVTTKTTAYNNAVTAYNTAKAAYDAAVAANSTFWYINESAAVASTKISVDYDEGKSYVSNVEIVKKNAVTTNATTKAHLGNKSSAYIYFLAVTFKDKSTTDEQVVDSDITLKKSGTYGFNFTLEYCILLDYPESTSSSGIELNSTKTKYTSDQFDDDEEMQIDIDGSSVYLTLDARSQGDIILACSGSTDVADDWDDLIYDEYGDKYDDYQIYVIEGYANAKFKRSCYIHVPLDEDDYSKAILYRVVDDDYLEYVSEAKINNNEDYDEEVVFKLPNNNLNCTYVISTIKLDAFLEEDVSASSSSSGTGSSSTSGTGTSTSSGTGTSSSSSSSTSSSSSSSSSSTTTQKQQTQSQTQQTQQTQKQQTTPKQQEPEEIEEPEEDPEEIIEEIEEDEEDEDVYQTVTIDEDAIDEDLPVKEGGISWVVWVLIIGGLVAVLIVVGVIFYTKNGGSGSRMM